MKLSSVTAFYKVIRKLLCWPLPYLSQVKFWFVLLRKKVFSSDCWPVLAESDFLLLSWILGHIQEEAEVLPLHNFIYK